MSYQATIYKVMIASPGDVSAERKLIREILNDWNVVNADARKIVLLPIGWETHSSPEMGDRPQAILNKQILKDCDLLVGVFWTRIGTATGEFASGTVEEIEEHIKADKPAMLYFSQTPVELDSVDSEQYENLKTFKNECESRGVYEVYNGIEDFKEKFNRQLQLKLNNDPYFNSDPLSFSTDIRDIDEPILSLSQDAQYLLKEAAESREGTILKIGYMGGFQIQANGKQFNKDYSPRERAKWESVFNELLSEGLIETRGAKGEVYAVTKDGYNLADSITTEQQAED